MTNAVKKAIETTKAAIQDHKAEMEKTKADFEKNADFGNAALNATRVAILHYYGFLGAELRMLENQLQTLEEIAAEEDAAAPTEETTAEPKVKPAKAAARFSPVAVYLDGGESKLAKELSNLEVQELKDIIRDYSLDKTGNYRKWKNRERLEELIMRRSEARATRGDCFRIFTGNQGNAYTA